MAGSDFVRPPAPRDGVGVRVADAARSLVRCYRPLRARGDASKPPPSHASDPFMHACMRKDDARPDTGQPKVARTIREHSNAAPTSAGTTGCSAAVRAGLVPSAIRAGRHAWRRGSRTVERQSDDRAFAAALDETRLGQRLLQQSLQA